MREGVVEVESGRKREDVDTLRFSTQLHHDVGFLEVGGCQAEAAEAERRQSVDDAVRVRRIRPYPDVEVLGVAGMAVRGQCVAPTIRKRTS